MGDLAAMVWIAQPALCGGDVLEPVLFPILGDGDFRNLGGRLFATGALSRRFGASLDIEGERMSRFVDMHVCVVPTRVEAAAVEAR